MDAGQRSSDEREGSGSNGVARIAEAFRSALIKRRAALMPYYALGYPDRATSIAVVKGISSHSDLLELGIPFSDPLADGPTVQRSTQMALDGGASTLSCLAQLAELRDGGMQTPVLLMGYYNPILAFGEDRFAEAAASAGADGLIVPDLPPEEADVLESAAARHGLALIYLLAPTSDGERLQIIASRARGFIYLVALTGVTGARSELGQGLSEFVRTVGSLTSLPLAVGFGISTPEQVAEVGAFADGVIVGSALLNAVESAQDKVAAAEQYVRSLKLALRR